MRPRSPLSVSSLGLLSRSSLSVSSLSIPSPLLPAGQKIEITLGRGSVSDGITTVSAI